jgi:hypothetical protein
VHTHGTHSLLSDVVGRGDFGCPRRLLVRLHSLWHRRRCDLSVRPRPRTVLVVSAADHGRIARRRGDHLFDRSEDRRQGSVEIRTSAAAHSAPGANGEDRRLHDRALSHPPTAVPADRVHPDQWRASGTDGPFPSGVRHRASVQVRYRGAARAPIWDVAPSHPRVGACAADRHRTGHRLDPRNSDRNRAGVAFVAAGAGLNATIIGAAPPPDRAARRDERVPNRRRGRRWRESAPT